MKKENKYMVLCFYENSIQGEYSVAGHSMTLKQAIEMRDSLIKQQKNNEIDEDFLIDDVEKSGIKIVEYVDFVY